MYSFVVAAVTEEFRTCIVMLMVGLCAGLASAEGGVSPPPPELLTNLLQLRMSADQTPSVVHPFRIVADVMDADSARGVLVLRDTSSVEFVRVDFRNRDVEPGATVCLEARGCAVKLNGFGLKVVHGMVVNNDGIHPVIAESGMTFLHAGKNPITVKWFNLFGLLGLNVEYEGPNVPRQQIPSSALSRLGIDTATGRTNFSAGLDYRCYEGLWEYLPDFRKYQPSKSGVAANFDLNVRTRDATAGLEFNGFLTIPVDGVYTFHLASDDGSQLFVGDSYVEVRVLSKQPAPAAADKVPSSEFERNNRPLVALEGIVTCASISSVGGELQMRVGDDNIRVEVFESSGAVPTIPARKRVRVSGIYEEVVTEDGARVPGRLLVSSWNAVVSSAIPPANANTDREITNPQIEAGVSSMAAPAAISTAAEIKALSSDRARLELPVSIRGVVTAYISKFLGGVVQDSTKGVYVDVHNLREAEPLQLGEVYQIEGVTGPGLFAPIVVARRITHLGPGRLPAPQRATRDELMDGSLDTQYVELDGVVTAIHDRQVVLLIRGGKITLDLIDLRPESLLGLENALVRIQGCVFASFNMETRKLGLGSLAVRRPQIGILQPAPGDLFDAPRKKMGELLLYDPNAAPFRLLKVSGQIIYGRPGEYFLTDGTNGMHVTTKNADPFSVGELVDAVGFLELGGPSVELKEALMRRIGSAPLSPPARLPPGQLLQASYADMLVQVEATLMNQWREGSEYVLELQSGFLAFKARVNNGGRPVKLPPTGSRLELTGTYAPNGSRVGDGTVGGFELLLHSPAGIRIVTTPPWWTVKRVLALVGILAALLCAVLIWNTELHRKVQERGCQLEGEIRNRQSVELKHAAEAERARIARDLHDELGTGLTEVSLLAGTGLGEFRDAEKISDRFRVISEKARALVVGLDVIVWAIDPKRNSLQSFADYLGRYVTELFSASGIVCRFEIPIECEPVTLSEAERHGLFLAVKEALNNVIRHASATELSVQMTQTDKHIKIVISDNGRGFDPTAVRCGNGLTNLQERSKALNGECHIESRVGKGTSIKFIVPLPRDPS
jgi:signal transduction histidine kinase